MSTSARAQKVAQEIQAAVANMISKGMLRDPRIGFITITGVKVSPDLRVARVYYSTLGSEEERAGTQEGLEAAKGFIRREVTRSLSLRVSPEIYFAYDASVSEGDKIDRLLRKVREEEGW